MRKPLIAGNWKMHKTEAEAINLVRKLMRRLRNLNRVEVLVCPPFTALSQLNKLLVSSPIYLGAQNISAHPQGAYTGEISASMVAEFCTHVILGHSERRTLYGETDELINRKIKAARQANLIPILCIGEKAKERQEGTSAQILTKQLKGGLKDIVIKDSRDVLIAYEPVWAIGSGQSPSPENAADVIGELIRHTLTSMWGAETAQATRILYGGSVNPANAGRFLTQEEIDGVLVGGASLDAEMFLSIVEHL